MQVVKCKQSVLDKIYDTFDVMDYTAEDYVPTQEELVEMCKDIGTYMPFLLWIEETGEDTEENVEIRSIIRSVIKRQLAIIDD